MVAMNVIKSALPTVPIPHVNNLGAYIMEGFDSYGDRRAMINAVTGEEYTYRQLRHYAERVASGLSKRGFCRADVLAIYSYNIPEYAIALLATLLLGGTVTTINPLYTEDEVLYQLKDSATRWLITVPENTQKAQRAAVKSNTMKEIFVFGEADGFLSFRTLMEDEGAFYSAPVNVDWAESIALLMYSSGTTGLPKGVMITPRNLVAVMEVMKLLGSAIKSKDNTPILGATNEVVLGVMPFYHVSGLNASVISSLMTGSAVAVLPRFRPQLFLATIEKYKIKKLSLVPPLVLFLAKHPLVDKYDLSHIQLITCGAAPLSKELAETVINRLGGKAQLNLFQGYGMTETTLATHVMMNPASDKYNSVGELMCNLECKIIDVETGASLPRGREGEVCVRGPQIMKGYLNKPAETAKTIDADDWLHTGDIGYVDNEACLFIVDRFKELIKYKGFQVAPAELEAKLLHHPSVSDVAVIGVPDEEAGELPKAYVVRTDQRLLADDLHSYLGEHVAPHKRLRGGIEFVSEIPKSAAGKILRRQLREKNKKLSHL